MARVKTGIVRRRRHKKILKANKGYSGARSKQFRKAFESWLRAGEHAFAGRKLKKRNMKQLWIIRLNAALRSMDISYSKFIHNLKSSEIALDRKTLAELATTRPEAFKAVVNKISKKS